MLEPEQQKTVDFKILLFIFVYSFVLGVIFDVFFYNDRIGVSFPVYTLLILAGLFLLTNIDKRTINSQTLLLMIVALLTSAMVFIRSSSLLTDVNILVTVFTLLLVVESSIGLKIGKYRVRDYLSTLLVPFEYIATFAGAVSSLGQHIKLVRNSKVIAQIFRGILITIPFVAVLAILLSSADLVFEKHLKDLIDVDISLDSVLQVFIVLFVTSVFIGAYYFILTRNSKNIVFPIRQTLKDTGKLSTIELSILFGSINLLFMLFIIVQLTYLFGGVNNITDQGFTYAEYARKGFFELIAVALISFYLIWFSDEAILDQNNKKPLVHKILTGILVVFVQLIMISAFKRLSLYEDAFGFTALRLYSHFFTVWLGVVFAFLLYKILINKRDERFFLKVAILSYVFLFTINIMNPDQFIARKNIERYLSTGKIDIAYLSNISNDAVPFLTKFINVKNKDVEKRVGYILYWRDIAINAEPHKQWFTLTLAEINAQKQLAEISKSLERFKEVTRKELGSQ